MKNSLLTLMFMFLLVGCGSETFTVADDGQGFGGAPSETGGSAAIGSGGDAAGGAATGGAMSTGGVVADTGGSAAGGAVVSTGGATGGAATGGSGSAPNALGLAWSDVASICNMDIQGWDTWDWGTCSGFPEVSGPTEAYANVVFTMPARTRYQNFCGLQGMKALYYCGSGGCMQSPADATGSSTGWTYLYLCKD